MDIGSSNYNSKVLSGFNVIRQCVKEKRPSLDKLWQNIFKDDVPYNGSLIEISASDNYNSYLLYKLLAYASTINNYEKNNCEIIFIDLMYKFDIDIFVNNILKPIREQIQLNYKREYQMNSEEMTDNMDNILNSITIYDCYTSEELEISLNEIERLLWHNSNIGILIIDGIVDKLYDSPLNLLTKLQTIGQNLNVCCIYTKRYDSFEGISTNLGYICVKNCYDLSTICKRSFPFSFNNNLPFLLQESCVK